MKSAIKILSTFFTIFIFFLLAKNVNAVVWDNFNTYPVGGELDAVSSWSRYAGNARGYIEGDGFNNWVGVRSTTTNQYAIYLRDATNVVSNTVCFDYKADAMINTIFRMRNIQNPVFGPRIQLQSDSSGLARLLYNDFQQWVYTDNYYRADNQYINICLHFDCAIDKYDIYINGFKIYGNINTYNSCGTIGRFEFETYPNPDDGPGFPIVKNKFGH